LEDACFAWAEEGDIEGCVIIQSDDGEGEEEGDE
jgi:hypothetical protein